MPSIDDFDCLSFITLLCWWNIAFDASLSNIELRLWAAIIIKNAAILGLAHRYWLQIILIIIWHVSNVMLDTILWSRSCYISQRPPTAATGAPTAIYRFLVTELRICIYLANLISPPTILPEWSLIYARYWLPYIIASSIRSYDYAELCQMPIVRNAFIYFTFFVRSLQYFLIYALHVSLIIWFIILFK